MIKPLRARTSLRKSILLTITLSASLICHGQVRAADNQGPIFPRLDGVKSNPDLELSLDIARAAFNSSEPRVFDAAYKIAPGFKQLALWQRDWHTYTPGIKDGKFVWPDQTPDSMHLPFNPAYFAYRATGQDASVYLQKTPQNGSRLALKQSVDHAEETYDLLAVKSDQDLGAVFSSLDTLTPGQNGQLPILANSTVAPWIFVGSRGELVAMAVDQPFVALSDWRVYKLDEHGQPVLLGSIAFMPHFAHDFDLLPAGALKKMALLLDNMTGKAEPDHGGFAPAARLKTRVRHMWANLIYRPWAMEQPPDTREAVDSAMQKWSLEKREQSRQYNELKALYTQALKQLATHYGRTLKLSDADASTLATKNLDLALRTNFCL